MRTFTSLADNSEAPGRQASVGPVLREIEKIVANLPCAKSFDPVLQAARDGALSRDPRELYFYLYGAVHASGMDEESWELVDRQLDLLRA